MLHGFVAQQDRHADHRGATLKTFTTNTISDTIGPFTKEKELLNGRAAMIGMAGLLGFEAIKHVPLL